MTFKLIPVAEVYKCNSVVASKLYTVSNYTVIQCTAKHVSSRLLMSTNTRIKEFNKESVYFLNRVVPVRILTSLSLEEICDTANYPSHFRLSTA